MTRMVVLCGWLLALGACATDEAEVPSVETDEVAREDVPQAAGTNMAMGHDRQDVGHFGGDFTLTGSEPVATLIADPAPYDGKTVRVVGEITSVCQKKGCWMVLRGDDGQTMRITMKDHGFAVDMNAAGQVAHAEGIVTVKDVDPDTVAHFKSETAEGVALPEEGKDRVVELSAVAVQIEPKA